MKLQVIVALLGWSILTGCENNDAYIASQLAGVYAIEEQRIDYYSNNGTVLDSSQVFTGESTITLVCDDPTLGVNSLAFSLENGRFFGWQDIPRNTPITWGTIEKDKHVLLFSNGPDGDPYLNEITLVSYTIEYKTNGKQEWHYVRTDAAGAMVAEEIIKVKKI